jgi:hypothetical protein
MNLIIKYKDKELIVKEDKEDRINNIKEGRRLRITIHMRSRITIILNTNNLIEVLIKMSQEQQEVQRTKIIQINLDQDFSEVDFLHFSDLVY